MRSTPDCRRNIAIICRVFDCESIRRESHSSPALPQKTTSIWLSMKVIVRGFPVKSADGSSKALLISNETGLLRSKAQSTQGRISLSQDYGENPNEKCIKYPNILDIERPIP